MNKKIHPPPLFYFVYIAYLRKKKTLGVAILYVLIVEWRR